MTYNELATAANDTVVNARIYINAQIAEINSANQSVPTALYQAANILSIVAENTMMLATSEPQDLSWLD